MSVQTFIIMTEADSNAAQALNDENYSVIPRIVDNALAGEGPDGQPLFGRYVAPARILNDPNYSRWLPSLSVLPRMILDSDMIFAPVID